MKQKKWILFGIYCHEIWQCKYHAEPITSMVLKLRHIITMALIIRGEKVCLNTIQNNSHWLNKQFLAQSLQKGPKIMAMNLQPSQAKNSVEKNKTISLLHPVSKSCLEKRNESTRYQNWKRCNNSDTSFKGIFPRC